MEQKRFHGNQLCGYFKNQEYLIELISFSWQLEPQQIANTRPTTCKIKHS